MLAEIECQLEQHSLPYSYYHAERCSGPRERAGHPTNITFPGKWYLAWRIYHHQIQPRNIGDVFPTVS